jgi:hypothetical protein
MLVRAGMREIRTRPAGGGSGAILRLRVAA